MCVASPLRPLAASRAFPSIPQPSRPTRRKTRLCAAEDLDEEGLDQVKASVAEVFDNPPAHATYSEMARRIRLDLDKKMHGGSRGWSVVVGRAFGAYITQKIKNYAYVSVFPGAFGAPPPPPFRHAPRFSSYLDPSHARMTGVNVLVWKV